MDDVVEEKDGRHWLHAEVSREHHAWIASTAIANGISVGDVVGKALEMYFASSKSRPRHSARHELRRRGVKL